MDLEKLAQDRGNSHRHNNASPGGPQRRHGVVSAGKYVNARACTDRGNSNDALRARGIIPAKLPSRSPTPEAPEASEVRESQLKRATVADLDSEIDALENAADDDEERRLLALRRQRLNDLARERKRGKFGRVYPITRPDYTREVTEASKEQQQDDDVAEGERGAEGTGVVCFLYKDG